MMMDISRQRLFLLALYFYSLFLDVSSLSTLPPSSTSPCFVSCVCGNDSSVVCTADEAFKAHISDFNKFLLNTTLGMKSQVHFKTGTDSLPEFLPKLPVVRYLSLAWNELKTIQGGVLKGMRLRQLNLSHNEIEVIEDDAFEDMHYLHTLDLSHNKLSSVSYTVFSNFPHLNTLVFNYNQFEYFPLDSFSRVPCLEKLALNHNRLSYLMPGSLSGMSALRDLELRNNSLRSLTVNITEELPALETVDLSLNPFHCSCSFTQFFDLNSTQITLIGQNETLCATPLTHQGQVITKVMGELGDCQKPDSVLGYDEQSVMYQDDVTVSCDIQGDPEPALLWVTPWGQQFADPAHLPRLQSVCLSCENERHYSSIGIYLKSTISLIRGGKGLHITNFRGFFNGNVTCYAYNYLGNDTAVRKLEVYCGIPSTVHDSLYMGGFCAGGFLCLGLLIGSIKLLTLACLARFGIKRKVRHTPATTLITIHDDFTSLTFDDNNDDIDNFSDEFCTPYDTLISNTPAKLHSPVDGQSTPTDAARPTNILETMEEAKVKLRQEVGRKMKTMKRNVQSIRESGSVYVHNIMETGSTAANKVKAGVVMGVETVKYHVQSFKEFCGTGDMGDQTISTFSIETNLDTDETREIVKSTTLV